MRRKRLLPLPAFQVSTILVFIVLAAFFAANAITLFQPFLPYEDDAYIFLRYVRNITHGYGIVWNVGEPPVEGYTSYLYLILLAGLHLLGITSESILGWIGIFSSTLSLLLTWRILQTLLPKKHFIHAITIALIVFSPGFSYWARKGLDVPFFTLLLLLAVFTYLHTLEENHTHRLYWLIGILFALVALARPEGVLLFLLTLGFEYVKSTRLDRRRWKHALKHAWLMALAFGTVYIPYFLWRWQYFGYFFPNTYYAKTGAGLLQIREGISYVWEALTMTFTSSFVGLFLSLMMFAPFSKSQHTNIRACYLLLVTLGIWGITAINGGDHFSFGRFIVPSLPYLGILIVIGVKNLYDYYKIPVLILIFLTLPALAFHHIKNHAYAADVVRSAKYTVGRFYGNSQGTEILPRADHSRYQAYPEWIAGFTVMGRTLKQIALPGDSIAVVPIGAIGYYSEMRVIDMTGLVDPFLAHEPFDPVYIQSWRPGHDKGNGEYILSLKPTYIQLLDQLTSQPRAEPDEHMFQYKSVVEIWNSDRFHEEYEFYPIQVENGWYYNLYKRKK